MHGLPNTQATLLAKMSTEAPASSPPGTIKNHVFLCLSPAYFTQKKLGLGRKHSQRRTSTTLMMSLLPHG